MASCKDCKHYPMCGFSKYTKTPEKCLDFLDVSDVIKVVRCKDCKRFVEDKETFVTYCSKGCGIAHVKPDDFCSHAERITAND